VWRWERQEFGPQDPTCAHAAVYTRASTATGALHRAALPCAHMAPTRTLRGGLSLRPSTPHPQTSEPPSPPPPTAHLGQHRCSTSLQCPPRCRDRSQGALVGPKGVRPQPCTPVRPPQGLHAAQPGVGFPRRRCREDVHTPRHLFGREGKREGDRDVEAPQEPHAVFMGCFSSHLPPSTVPRTHTRAEPARLQTHAYTSTSTQAHVREHGHTNTHTHARMHAPPAAPR
jgi:hypothetical protein